MIVLMSEFTMSLPQSADNTLQWISSKCFRIHFVYTLRLIGLHIELIKFGCSLHFPQQTGKM